MTWTYFAHWLAALSPLLGAIVLAISLFVRLRRPRLAPTARRTGFCADCLGWRSPVNAADSCVCGMPCGRCGAGKGEHEAGRGPSGVGDCRAFDPLGRSRGRY